VAAAREPHVALAIGQLSYGGAETQLCELVEGLAGRARVTVYCLSGRSQPLGERVEAAGARLVVFAAKGGFDLGRVRDLRRCILADRPTLVHAFLYIADAYVWAAMLGLRGGVPFVASARNCKVESNRLRRLLVGRALASADAVVCNSAEMARFAVERYGVPDDRPRVVYNGVDAERFHPRAGRSPGPLRIGTVGRIERQKNLDLFLAAACNLLQTKEDAIFEVVGEGSLKDAFERRVAAAGLAANIRFVGTSARIPEFLRGLDQFWLTSDWEGTPNVVLEAMASGLPVLATRVGGTPELIDDGRTGCLVDAGDEAGLSALARDLAEDPGRARRLGEAARREVEARFSVPAMVAATEDVYREVLGAVGRAGEWPANVGDRGA
jgi:glycosyltransferase involved in cell wall biosynthesis